MAEAEVVRRLAAVLVADVVGYSRLMERNEQDTFARLQRHRAQLIEPSVQRHHGRLVKRTGDGVLCEFASIVDAVACALAIQAGMAEREDGSPEDRRMRLRIGVNLGDFMLDPDGDIYGGVVNMTTRLQAMAEPGGICISGAAHDQLRGRLDCEAEDLGERVPKAGERPMRVFRIRPAGTAPPPPAIAVATGAVLQVTAFGGFSAAIGGAPVELRSRKAQALLVYLLLNPTPAETRERLCGLLWSESSEERARSSLRQVLHGLRETLEALGFHGLQMERETVQLARPAVRFDIAELLAALDRRETPAALETTPRPAEAMLAGFDGLDPGFDVWLAVQRRLVCERLERGLLANLDAAGGAPAARIAAASALVNLDPTNELACRRLMEAHAARGELPAALKVYKQLWDHLDAEYDMEPATETQALVARLKSEPPPADPSPPAHAPAAPAAPAARPPPAQRAVVVAPFDTRGVSGEFAYLVTGLRQDLLTKLVRFREWIIIDGQHLAGGAQPEFEARWPRQIWIDLFVAQAGNRLKATLSVREQPEASLIWSDTFRFNLDNWFDIEREVLARVAATMNLHISTARLLGSAGKPEMSLEIYDRWLRGQSIIMNWRPERDRARQLYRAILAEAPDFSPAWSSLAQLESGEHLALPGVFRTKEREAAGLEHATQAVRSDPFDSRAHLALGWASAMNGLFDQSAAAFQTALELNENDMWTINSAALGTAYCGDVPQSIALVDRALALGLKPTGLQSAFQGVVRFLAGDYVSSIRAHAQSGDVLTDIPAWRAAALALSGAPDEARAVAGALFERCRRLWPGEARPEPADMARWLLHAFPIRDRATWERLREGLAGAGLPIPPEAAIPRHP